MKPDICIYHSPCADGFGAAWAVWRKFGDGVQYVPGVYGEAPPSVIGKHVLMVDFSYKRPVLERMGETAKSIIVLDHHKTAQADLEAFRATDIMSPGPDYEIACGAKIAALFDMDRSGAQMAWDFCHPGKPRPRLIDYIADRDLWRFDLPNSRAVAAWLFSHPYDFDLWHELASTLAHNTPGVVAEGEAIERKHHKDIGELLAQTKRTMVIGGQAVPVANLPYTMASDAAHALAKEAPFAACYFDRADTRVFSLRSHGDGGADVSAIAKAYGGGGHKNAAGFQMPIGWEGEAA